MAGRLCENRIETDLEFKGPNVESLSLEQKVGQILCLGWQSDACCEASSVNRHARVVIEELSAGAVVLLSRNISAPEKTGELLNELQSISEIPLLIAIDQEGGSVNRMGPPLHQFPGNMALGAVACGSGMEVAEYLTRRQTEAQAIELRSIGINWNFAPVVDVNNNPDNPIIGVRSYGEDPQLVGRLGAAAIAGYQDAGVMACAKHFPGHGDTAVDSHLALPTNDGTRDRLEQVELAPFRAAISAGVASIMTTHILFRMLDDEWPATIARRILNGLLRTELGYDGLVVTDCLEMNALADTVGTARAAVEAIKAGADIALVCHTLEAQVETRDAILRAARSGELAEERLNEAVERVLTAKHTYCMSNDREKSPWLNSHVDKIENEIAQKSVTVVRTNGMVPLRIDAIQSLLVFSAHASGRELAEFIRVHHEKTGSVFLGPSFLDALRENALRIAYQEARLGGCGVVLTAPREPWTTEPIDQEAQAEFIRALHAIYGDRLIAVALREPYDIRRFPDVQNYICTYGYRDCSLNALADFLLGKTTASGCPPVSIPGIHEMKGDDA